MNNKILRLGDFSNKSLDDIIDLYANGYRLEDQSLVGNIQYLQTPTPIPTPTLTPTPSPLFNFMIVSVLFAGIVAGITVIILTSKKKKKT